jgi:hypothetical protein
MHLLTRIQRHLRRTGLSPTAFGRRAVNDPRFVHDLRNGRKPGPRIQARVLAWIASHEENGR